MVNAQGISLPSPFGEGLGVRPVAVEVRLVAVEVRPVDNKLTSNKWSMHKAYHSPLPLERGWG